MEARPATPVEPARRKWVLASTMIGAGVVAAAGGYAVHAWLEAAGTASDASAAPEGKANLAPLWTAQLTDLAGNPVKFASFRNHALVVNFWASWCGPCIEEMPDFQKASQSAAGSRVKFIGIGIDYAKNMRPFAAKFGITYILLEAGAQGLDIMKAAGNSTGALPFTLILDRQGALLTRKLGKMSYAELTAVIGTL